MKRLTDEDNTSAAAPNRREQTAPTDDPAASPRSSISHDQPDETNDCVVQMLSSHIARVTNQPSAPEPEEQGGQTG